ncbi:hypothetical protein H4582DRAFT_170821 [Lactarius indigo]|nr:hypothetical protein H4582DRAFT_170821 [Lactarius indigo]
MTTPFLRTVSCGLFFFFSKARRDSRDALSCDDSEGSHIVYAIDCELFMTIGGKAPNHYRLLTRARINMINLPRSISDHLSCAWMRECALPLTMPSTILLGHSRESDLHALRIAHPYWADTELLFRQLRG